MGFCYDKISILVHNFLMSISNFPLFKLCILLCNDSGHSPTKFEEFLSRVINVLCGGLYLPNIFTLLLLSRL